MIIQFGILFLFLALGEIAVYFTGVPVPSSIIGMILLTCALKARLVKLSQVDKTANFMVHNLGFFFVPAGIGLMRCLGIVRDQWIPIVGASVVSTVVILWVTGWVHQFVRSRKPHLNGNTH